MAPFLLPLLLAACSHGPDVDKELDTVRSWTATARFAGERLRAGATSAAYTADLRDAIRAALTEARTQLADGSLPPADAARLRPATDSLALAVGTLGRELGAP